MSMPTPLHLPLALAVLASLLALQTLAAQEERVDFSRDVEPILSQHCYQCHGPSKQEADRGFDRQAGLFKAYPDDPAPVLPGQPDESELLLRLELPDDDPDAMPAEGKRLSPDELALIRRWIQEGAPWSAHWAFTPASHVAVPPVHHEAWPRNPVDHFILARLEAQGLLPASRAIKRTLIRRVTFDLTGLPPTRAEVAAFLDDSSEAAFEGVVDGLLASPAFGEHMAHFWLDLARYGDTHGLHFDNYREMWPYRDWVISAFNKNLPYDRFIVQQVAGDMLPDATREQKIASGFNRCNVSTNEGGAIAEEFYVRNVIDRVSTTGTAFMGLTVGCAVCHDHKFDPLSQKEFYQLFAFFNNLDGKPLDGNSRAHAPVIRVPDPEQTQALKTARVQLASIESEIDEKLAEVSYRDPTPEAAPATSQRVETIWVDDAFPPGATPEGDGLEWVEQPREQVYSGRLAMKRTCTGREQHFFANASRKLRVGLGDQLFCWVLLDAQNPPREIMLQFNDDGSEGWSHRAFWGEDLVPFGKAASTERRRMGDLPRCGSWVRLVVDCEQIGLTPGSVLHGMAFLQFAGQVCWDRAGIVSALPQFPVDVDWIDDDAPAGARLEGDGKSWQWVERAAGPVLSGQRSLQRGGSLGLNQDFFTQAPPLRLHAGDRLYAHVWLDPDDPPRSVQLQFHAGGWEHRVRWGAPAHGAGRTRGADLVAGSLPEKGRWVRLEVNPADVGLSAEALLDGWAFTQVGGTVWWDRAGVRTWSPPDERALSSQRVWEWGARSDPRLPEDIRAAASQAPAQRSGHELDLLQRHYLRHVFKGTRSLLAPLEARLAVQRMRIQATLKEIPTCMVMKERKLARPAYLLARGQYDARSERVQRKTPAMLPPMDPSLPRNRLGLARWLVDPGQPLVARVAVNHFWQQIFGTGLVKTAEDFGSQGERPSHPELLDWLATRFVDDGWDVKRMLKRLVLSATYQQASALTPELIRIDPQNRLLARGPRFRLDAEMLRDQVLALSGLLVQQVGGPSVKPPQPGGIWKTVGYVGSDTQIFKQDHGRSRVFRRSIYTFWKRTAPAPQMTIFDAPSRESCRARRERTNTPLQALVLMNGPQFVEAARQLATRTLKAAGPTARERAIWMFTTCTAHAPSRLDLLDMVQFLATRKREFAKHPAAAQKLLEVGETPPEGSLEATLLASWTLVANLVLNLDEVITKS